MKHVWLYLVWERKGPLGYVIWLMLLPLSFVYRLIIKIRNQLYSRGWIKSQALDVPVISVGNLTVGGTGKTPTCIWLSGELEQRGLKVGILSRGYGSSGSLPRLVPTSASGKERPEAQISEFGDEPTMMARLYGKTVCVGKRRYQAGKELLLRHKVDLLVLDDGYQHRAVKRDLDLLILGRDCTGSVLPAGPFRESRAAVRRADVCLVTGAQTDWTSYLTNHGTRSYFTGSLQAVCLIGYESDRIREYPLSLLDRSKIVTVAGIADPEDFYQTLHDWGAEIVDAMEFPDHHVYASNDWHRISRAARTADLIVTTEKDILKLTAFPFAREKLLALRVQMVVENGNAMIDVIIDRLRNRRTLNVESCT